MIAEGVCVYVHLWISMSRQSWMASQKRDSKPLFFLIILKVRSLWASFSALEAYESYLSLGSWINILHKLPMQRMRGWHRWLVLFLRTCLHAFFFFFLMHPLLIYLQSRINRCFTLRKRALFKSHRKTTKR